MNYSFPPSVTFVVVTTNSDVYDTGLWWQIKGIGQVVHDMLVYLQTQGESYAERHA